MTPTQRFLKVAFEFGAKLASQDNAAKLRRPIEEAMEDTPEQSHRFGGAMRRLLAAGTAAGTGALLGRMTGARLNGDSGSPMNKYISANHPFASAYLSGGRAPAIGSLIGGLGGGALGLYSPGVGGAIGGAGMGGGAGAWLGDNLVTAITGDNGEKANEVGRALGALGGMVGGGYLGYHALKD